MNLTPMQEEFMRNFFERQREISKQSRHETELLARSNAESILLRGLISPPTMEHMEKILEEIKARRRYNKQIQEGIEDLLNGE